MKRRKANAAILLLAAILFVNAAGAKALSVEVQTKTIEQEADDDPKLASLLTDLLKDHRLLHDDDIGSSIFSSTTAWRTFYRKSLEQLSESAAVYLRDTRDVHIESEPLITILREILKKANETSTDEATPKSSGKTLGVDYATCVKENITSVSNTLHKHTLQIKQYLFELNTSVTTARAETRLEHITLSTEVTNGHSATENRFQEKIGTFWTELLREVNTIEMLLLTKKHNNDLTELEDCGDVYTNGFPSPGVYAIRPPRMDPVLVWCSNGWTTLVRREIGDISFDRSAKEYNDGFGSQHVDHIVGFTAQDAITTTLKYHMNVEFRLDEPNATMMSFQLKGFFLILWDCPRLYFNAFAGLGGLSVPFESDLGDWAMDFLDDAEFHTEEGSKKFTTGRTCTEQQTTGFFDHYRCSALAFKSNTYSNGSSACRPGNHVCARMDKHLLRSIEMKIIKYERLPHP